MEIKPTKCNNCPFKVVDYNDHSTGDDTLLYCNLMKYLGFKIHILDTYDSLESCDHCNEAEYDSLATGEDMELYYDGDLCTCEEEPDIPVPDNCPIKNVDIKISIDD
jgi:hypothetical protein